MNPIEIQPQNTQVTTPQNATPSVSPQPTVVSDMLQQPAPQPLPVGQAVAPSAGFSVRSKALAGLAAVLLVAGGYFANVGVTRMTQANATNQAKSFIASLNAGNNSQAYHMASANLRSQQSASQFADNMGDLKSSTPKLSGQAVSYSGATAIYTATEDGLPKADDGSTSGTFTVSLVKSGLTGWKIDSVNIN